MKKITFTIHDDGEMVEMKNDGDAIVEDFLKVIDSAFQSISSVTGVSKTDLTNIVLKAYEKLEREGAI